MQAKLIPQLATAPVPGGLSKLGDTGREELLSDLSSVV